jgi:hypothetical protein
MSWFAGFLIFGLLGGGAAYYYWNYHGWEIPWCVTPETEVLMGDGSYKCIVDVFEGDLVQTLNGPRPVQNKVEIYNQPCCQFKVVDKNSKVIGVQNQGLDHCVLNTMDELDLNGTWSFGCSHNNLKFLNKFKTRDLPVVVYKNSRDDGSNCCDNFLQYIHPYSAKYMESDYFSGSIGRGYTNELDYRTNMIDLRVEEVNHYITKISNGFHVVNKNCGWEELTNFLSPDSYESIKDFIPKSTII